MGEREHIKDVFVSCCIFLSFARHRLSRNLRSFSLLNNEYHDQVIFPIQSSRLAFIFHGDL